METSNLVNSSCRSSFSCLQCSNASCASASCFFSRFSTASVVSPPKSSCRLTSNASNAVCTLPSSISACPVSAAICSTCVESPVSSARCTSSCCLVVSKIVARCCHSSANRLMLPKKASGFFFQPVIHCVP